jgi:L-xylulokinase
MTRISDPIMPDPERVRIYEKKYQLYVKIIESLDGLWDDMQELAEEKYDG